jgi:hypothetical protein
MPTVGSVLFEDAGRVIKTSSETSVLVSAIDNQCLSSLYGHLYSEIITEIYYSVRKRKP